MFFKRDLLLISLILCIFFSISCVAAEDIDDTPIGNENNDLMETDDEDLIVEDEGESFGSFSDLDQAINGDSQATEIYLNSSYVFDKNTDMDYMNQGGIEITRSLTIYGQGHTIDAKHNGSIFLVSSYNGQVVFKNLTFLNADCSFMNKPGGAIYVASSSYDCYADNCTFINNSAIRGGALYHAYAINSNFINNSGGDSNSYPNTGGGGAIYFSSMYGHIVTNCTFINNHAYTGGALYNCYADNCTFIENTAKDPTGKWGTGGAIFTGDATNCRFIGNRAGNGGGAVISGSVYNSTFINNYVIATNQYNSGGAVQFPENVVNCTFIGNYAARGGAVNEGANVRNSTFIDNHAIYEGGALYSSHADNCTFINNYASYGGAMYGAEYGSGYEVKNSVFISNTAYNEGGATSEMLAINCQFTNNHANKRGGAMNRGSSTGCLFIDNSAPNGNDVFNLTNTLFSLTNSPSGGGVAVKVYNSEGVPSIYYILGDASIGGIVIGNGTYNAVIAVNEPYIASIITADAVTTVYNGNKVLVITLKDEFNNPLVGVKVAVDLNGNKQLTTNSMGQIMLSTNNLAPKVYTAKIVYAGDDKIMKSSLNVKVTVKKANVKLTAKKKTFKAKVKTKKYTVTLKDNNNKAMKKVKITLKIKGKTYKAKTNSKGKATFKIKKFTKKGKFTSKITYKGNKYYNKLTKKVKIRIK